MNNSSYPSGSHDCRTSGGQFLVSSPEFLDGWECWVWGGWRLLLPGILQKTRFAAATVMLAGMVWLTAVWFLGYLNIGWRWMEVVLPFNIRWFDQYADICIPYMNGIQ